MKVGFVTDIHEDIINLENALRIIDEHKCDKVICLGDIVGFAIPFYKNIFSKDADACVKTVKNNCAHSVIGNHDLFAIKKTPVNTAGFEYGENWYSLDYETRSRLSRNKIWLYEDGEIPCDLSDESIEFLNSLDETAVVDLSGKSIFISHFCHPDFTGSHIHFPTEGFHLAKHFSNAASNNCLSSFSGHGHPEGCLVGNNESIDSIVFGMHRIQNEQQWIVCPSIARTSRKNGVLVFDSIEMELIIIPLSQ